MIRRPEFDLVSNASEPPPYTASVHPSSNPFLTANSQSATGAAATGRSEKHNQSTSDDPSSNLPNASTDVTTAINTDAPTVVANRRESQMLCCCCCPVLLSVAVVLTVIISIIQASALENALHHYDL
jgi:hypothetical protein